MRHLDLFSGIGGFALAARWMGWETVQFVEIDPFCQAVLRKNFNNVPIHGDIKTFGARHLRGSVDVLTGGFPCQPFSVAGKQLGKDDHRYLWPQMLRVVDEAQPKAIVGENVGGSWRMVDEICADLEHRGYAAEPISIEAASVGADHKRERFWFMAYTDGIRLQRSFEWMQEDQEQGIINAPVLSALPFQRTRSKDYIPKPYVIGGADGIPNRVDRIKSLGNAVVPQVVFQIFKAIELCSSDAVNAK